MCLGSLYDNLKNCVRIRYKLLRDVNENVGKTLFTKVNNSNLESKIWKILKNSFLSLKKKEEN